MLGEILPAGLRHSATPTMLAAGYKLNVVPREAVAEVDTRVLPGDEAGFRRAVERVVGDDGLRVHTAARPGRVRRVRPVSTPSTSVCRCRPCGSARG
jgi:acetylornithine deacetylase/succinyl-diaminopimelate desuccinylase-like protein